MAKKLTSKVKEFCSNKDGAFVLAQAPNVPIAGWIGFKLASMLPVNSRLQDGFGNIATAFLFTWAYLEIAEGESNFRKLLGTLVMLFTILSMLRM